MQRARDRLLDSEYTFMHVAVDQSLPEYDELDQALRGMEAMGAAEAHGVIAGVICGPRYSAEAWTKAVFADRNPAADSAAAERMLGALRAQTQARLAERQSGFTLLLPDEESSLGERVAALADFCRGYLYGLVVGGVRDLRKLPGDTREVIDDFMKISEAEAETTDSEADEQALAELTEYVCVGVQTIYEELHSGL